MNSLWFSSRHEWSFRGLVIKTARWVFLATMAFHFLVQSARSEEKKADPPTPELEIEAKIPDPKKDGIVLIEFKNKSQGPVRLWDMTYSWGWANLGIVLIKGGKGPIIERL